MSIEQTNLDQHQPMVVSFNNTELSMIEHNGKIYVPMKPICENIGLDWNGQLQRIKRNHILAQGMCMIHTPSKSGDQEYSCLPVGYLNGWLFGIDVNRVKPEIKDTLIKYQLECYDALWNYWTGKLHHQQKAFDEYNQIEFDEKLSKAKATIASHGMTQRKKEKRLNAIKKADWESRNVLTLNFNPIIP